MAHMDALLERLSLKLSRTMDVLPSFRIYPINGSFPKQEVFNMDPNISYSLLLRPPRRYHYFWEPHLKTRVQVEPRS